jgi:aryl-alcohol dehydrogenase-like predicted oxidoreductase
VEIHLRPEDGVIRRPLGKTGLEISPLALGANVFPAGEGEWYESYYGRKVIEDVADAERRLLIEAALALGINLFLTETPPDVAQMGRLLRAGDLRAQMSLLGLLLDWRPATVQAADPADLRAELDQLLDTLGTDRIEILNIRLGGTEILTPEFFSTLGSLVNDLKAAGTISAFSFYSHDRGDEVMLAGTRSGLFDAAYWNFGFLNPLAARRVLPAVAEREMGFIAFVPFQKGWLFECAQEAGLDQGRVAAAGLRWILAHPGVSSVAVGVADAAQLEANARAVDANFSANDEDLLRRLTQTETYEQFLKIVERDNPALFFDWRAQDGVGPIGGTA